MCDFEIFWKEHLLLGTGGRGRRQSLESLRTGVEKVPKYENGENYDTKPYDFGRDFR